jgi:hypothetical protein
MTNAQITPLPWKWDKYIGGEERAAEYIAAGMEPTRNIFNDGGVPIMSESGRVAVVDSCRKDLKPRADKSIAKDDERDANAAYIVKAANNHAALLAALKALAKVTPHNDPGLAAALSAALAAIAAAE